MVSSREIMAWRKTAAVKLLFSKQECSLCLRFFSETKGIPLNKPLPNMKASNPSLILDSYESSNETRITKLENGLTVASEESFGQFSTVGGRLS